MFAPSRGPQRPSGIRVGRLLVENAVTHSPMSVYMVAQAFDELVDDWQREGAGKVASSTACGEDCDYIDLKIIRGALFAVPIGTLLWVLIWLLILGAF